jgi:uncharacterized membrane protein/YHS domain-containing protein
MSFAAVILFVVAGLADPVMAAATEPSSQPPDNTMCPVTTNEAIDPAVWTVYQGETVYFCCNRCRKQFLDDPEAYVAGLPQFAAAHVDGHADDAHAQSGLPAASHEHETGSALEEHDHSRDHGDSEGDASGRAVRYVGKFHPLVVHFPIALILTALLAEILHMLRKRTFWGDAARWLIALGAMSAVAAATLGWMAATGAHYPGDLARTLWLHRWAGISVAATATAASALSLCARGRVRWLFGYRISLFLAAAAVAVAGHLGATLIFGADYFAW